MDKVLELVVAAMVLLIIASALLLLINENTSGFGEQMNSYQDSAKCQVAKTQHKNSFSCEDGISKGDRTDQLRKDANTVCQEEIPVYECENGEVVAIE